MVFKSGRLAAARVHWKKTLLIPFLPCPALRCCLTAAGQHRDAWHNRSSASIISTGARPAAEPSLRPSSLSAAPAGILSTSANGNSSGSSNLSRGDRDRDRDRDRAGHAAWSHFHTSSRSGRAGPRESAGGHSSSFDGEQTDRFQTLGSPFKHTGGNGSSSSSLPSRHGLQRSVSDSGGASSSADAVHSGFGTPQQRDRSHAGSSSHRQLGAAGSGSHYGYAAADDKQGWRDSNRDRQPHGQAGAHPGRGGNKVSLDGSGARLLELALWPLLVTLQGNCLDYVRPMSSMQCMLLTFTCSAVVSCSPLP
jgi:hypothetical protein